MTESDEEGKILSGQVKRAPDGLRFFADHEPTLALRLTMAESRSAVAPEAGELDLAQYEGRALCVAFEALAHGWVYGVSDVRPDRGCRA